MATKSFTSFKCDTNNDVRGVITRLIHDKIPETAIVQGWVKVNKRLYISWNDKDSKFHVATKVSDIDNEALFKHIARNNLYQRLPGSEGQIVFDNKQGRELNIKYMGRNRFYSATWAINPNP